jgi:hypothetical protein
MIDSTRLRVSADTSDRPLITFDTVGTDTPARSAISAIVIDRPFRRVGALEVDIGRDRSTSKVSNATLRHPPADQPVKG